MGAVLAGIISGRMLAPWPAASAPPARGAAGALPLPVLPPEGAAAAERLPPLPALAAGPAGRREGEGGSSGRRRRAGRRQQEEEGGQAAVAAPPPAGGRSPAFLRQRRAAERTVPFASSPRRALSGPRRDVSGARLQPLAPLRCLRPPRLPSPAAPRPG